MKKILIPIDFSNYSLNALKFASEIAKAKKVELHVLHAVEYPSRSTIDPIGLPQEIVDQPLAIALLDEARKKVVSLCKSKVIKWHTWIELGNPYLSIRKYVSDKSIDLVIMGTKGASDLKEIVVGSNAERVVRTSECPVITMTQPVNLKAIKSIAFGIDVDDDISNKLFLNLKKIQAVFAAKLLIVHVNTPNTFKRDIHVKKEIEAVIKKHRLQNTTLHIYNDFGVEEGILSFAEESGVGMLALGTHGKKGFLHFVSGTTTENVVKHAKRPVWTYHV